MTRRKKTKLKLPDTGIFDNITNAEYHGKNYAGYIGHSGLVRLLQSPAHYRAGLENAEQTQAMAFGSAAHTVMLEDESVIAVGDFPSKNSQKYQYWEMTTREITGKEIFVLQSEWDALQAMKKVLFDNPLASALLQNGKAEHTVLWAHPMFSGVMCKARPDYWICEDNLRLIIDYKTTANAGEDDFVRNAIRYGYDVQAKWYIDGMREVTGNDYRFIFVAQEKVPPFAVGIYEPSMIMLELGNKKINQALTTYWNCLEDPALWGKTYREKIVSMVPPVYELQKWGL